RFIEEYCRCHQSIAQAIDVLQGDQIASYGYLLPTLIMTRRKLVACKDLKFHYCSKLILGLIGAIEKRIENIFDVVEEGKTAAVAPASHPMFKLTWLPFLTKDAQDNVMEAIREAIKKDYEILNFYRIVREIFLKTNTILPSSAPVERLFSYATMYDLPKFNKLTDKNFELRVIMK
ncbi:GSCOCG00011554001-RA-CDS, partial [Cotesia congregata]